MRLPITLSGYIARQCFSTILIALAVVIVVIGMIDLVELIRRTAGKEGVPFHIVLEMAAFKLPFMAEKVLPYAVLIGAVMALTKMTRSNELIIARASGVSVWQFLFPALLLAFCIGVVTISIFNPISAAMIAKFEQLESRYISGNTSLLSVSSSGLWLRQADAGDASLRNKPVGEYILHAKKISQFDMSFSDITLFTYDTQGGFIGRLDAEVAQLQKGYWELKNATFAAPGILPRHYPDYTMPTQLRIAQIKDSFAEPRTLSFWQLAGFIQTLEMAGFDALRHKVHWHAVLASPFMLCGMVLLAALFSLRLPRRGKISFMIMGALLAGFVVNFLVRLFHAFGYSGSLSVELAAWAPVALVNMLGLALLLHFEDG